MNSYLGRADLVPGLRNNNPGNLVKTDIPWLGKIPHSKNATSRFEQFIDLKHGIRAMLRDIINDIAKGSNTIEKLINQYAPPFENNTKAYINAVSKSVGIPPTTQITVIDNAFLLKVARAIINHENGKDAKLISDSHIKSAINILGPINLKSINVDVKPFLNIAYIIPILLFFYSVLTVSL